MKFSLALVLDYPTTYIIALFLTQLAILAFYAFPWICMHDVRYSCKLHAARMACEWRQLFQG